MSVKEVLFRMPTRAVQRMIAPLVVLAEGAPLPVLD